MPVATRATRSEVRAPYNTRTKRSRPAVSAPNQKSPLGPIGRPISLRASDTNTSFWSWPTTPESRGAPTVASTIMKAMKNTPATANLSRRNRRQNSWLGLRPTTCLLGSPPASGPVGSTTTGSPATCATLCAPSGQGPADTSVLGQPEQRRASLEVYTPPRASRIAPLSGGLPKEADQARQDVGAPSRTDGAVRGGSLAEGGGPIGLDPRPTHQERHRVRRVSLPEARGGVVCRHGEQDLPWIDRRQDLAEEGPVDDLDHVALVLGPAIVGGDVGALDVHVQRVVAVQGVGRQPGPGSVALLWVTRRRCRHLSHPQDQGDPPLHRHLHEAPPRWPESRPDLGQPGTVVTGVPRQDQVRREPALGPAPDVRLGRLEDHRRLAHEGVRQVRRPPGPLAGQVPAHPAVDDPAVLLRGEVHSVGQVAVIERHP